MRIITEQDAVLRINAMAAEFREIIASVSQHSAELSVSNALANQTIVEQESRIKDLNDRIKHLQEEVDRQRMKV